MKRYLYIALPVCVVAAVTAWQAGLIPGRQLPTSGNADTPANPAPETSVPKAAPAVFNHSIDGAAGRLVYLQGASFGDTPQVWLLNERNAPRRQLDVLNTVGDFWLAARIPEDENGALIAAVSNGSQWSAPAPLNQALAYHADTAEIYSGASFRIFGRQLLLTGATPIVTIAGKRAEIDLAHSAEHMLTIRAPAGLEADSTPKIEIDNGNGSGAVVFTPEIRVGKNAGNTAGANPLKLDVPWANVFQFAQKVVDAGSGPNAVKCNGKDDIGPALQRTIDAAIASGGALVRLPAGRCVLDNRIDLKSGVVLEGRGPAKTQLVYSLNYPVSAVGQDGFGMRDLALINSGKATEGPLWKENRHSFMQRVTIDVGISRQSFLSDNQHFAMLDSQFIQRGSFGSHGPYVFANCSAMIFRGNQTVWSQGALNFNSVRDAVIENNEFIRDASQKKQESVIHGLTLDFAYRTSLLGNKLSVRNGPVLDTNRNDGEAILTEGGATGRTENYGDVADAGNDWIATGAPAPASPPDVPAVIASRNFGVAIISGKGFGQMRSIVGNAEGRMQISPAWTVVPDRSSRFATFAWGFEKSVIADNQLTGQPRGLWLYQSATRDVDILRNRFTEGGGIYLRAQQSGDRKQFDPIYSVRITGNQVTNTTGPWLSYIGGVYVLADQKPAGTGMLGIEISDNIIQAHRPNRSSRTEDHANVEGYFGMLRHESFAAYQPGDVPPVLGILLDNNQCNGCDRPLRIGTGVAGTTQLRALGPVDDTITVTKGTEASTNTVAAQ